MKDQTLGHGEYYGRVVLRREVAGLLLTETHYRGGTQVPLHAHENPYICFVSRGSYAEDFNGRTRTCGPATLAFHPAGEMHAERFDTAECRSLNIELLPRWRDRFDADSRWLRIPSVVGGGAAPLLASRLVHEFRQRDAASELAVEGLVLEVVAALARAPLPVRRPHWLDDVRERLSRDPQSRPDLARIARDAGVHPVYLAAAFRRHFQCTIGDYQRRARVEHACRLLGDRRRSLAAVAAASGFADQSHLGRMFKRYLGVSPGAYRRGLHGVPEPSSRSRRSTGEDAD